MYLLLIFFLTLAIPFIVMPGMIQTATDSPYKVVLRSTLVISAAAAVVFIAASLTGAGIYSQLQELAKLMSTEAAKNPMVIEALNMAGINEAERADVLVQIYNSVFQVLPVSIMFMGLVVSYIAYLILSRLLKRHKDVRMMPKFREFSFSRGTGTAIMLMYLFTWILTETGIAGDMMLYANINLLFDLVFSLQGVAVVLMFVHLKRLPRALGIVFVIVLWGTSIGKLFLILLGLFDLMMGLKSRIQGRNIR